MMTLKLPTQRVRASVAATLVGACMVVWTPIASAGLPLKGYADLVEKVSPAVVFISTTQQQPKQKPGTQQEF